MATRTNDLTPGLELDKAIAKACGFKVRVRNHLGTGEPLDLVIDATGNYFHPSTDLNCALEAAKAVGLFQSCDHILGCGSVDSPNGPWFVNHTRYRDSELSRESEVASAATPALAICAAILKLKEQH